MERLIFNEATTGRRLRPGALLIIYINIVRGVNRPWGETPMGRDVHGVKRLWGGTSMERNVLPWGEVSMGRNVSGAKSPDTVCTPFFFFFQSTAQLQHVEDSE